MEEVQAIAKRKTLSDEAMDRILELIVKGSIKPGERIQEALLARQLGISRGPLREAIRRLEGRRLLVRVPHVGVKVAEMRSDDVLDIFLMREALEGVACRLAAERITDAELNELSQILEVHAKQKDVVSGDGYYQSSGDQDFHFRIIKASRSERLSELLLGDLYEYLRIFRYRSSVKPGRAAEAHKEHNAVLEALKAHDSERAEAAMRNHLGHAIQSLSASLGEQPNQKSAGAA